MRRKWILFLYIFIILVNQIMVWGDEQVSLTLTECESRVLTANHSLVVQTLSRDASRAAADAAYTLYFPTVSISGGYSRTSPQEEVSVTLPLPPPLVLSPNIEDNFFVRVEVQQNIFTGFKIQSAVSLAEAQYRIQDAAYRLERAQVLHEARLAYLGLSQAIEVERLLSSHLAIVRARMAEVKKMQGQGLATHNDMLKAELAVSQAEYEAKDTTHTVRLARAKLNLLLGLPLETTLVPQDFSSLVAGAFSAKSLEEAFALAQEHRAELKAAQGRVAAGEAGVASASAGLYPVVVLKGNYTLANPNPHVFPREAEWNGTWEIGAALSIDLGAYPQTFLRMEEARRRLSSEQTRCEQVGEGIKLEVLASRLELERSELRLRTADKMLMQADENVRVVTEKHHNGQAVLSDVLDAKITWLRAQLTRVQALGAQEAARITYLHKQGLSWQPITP